MSPGAKVQERQNGACKNFTTRVKSRSQARLHRRQTSSDGSRLVRTVGEGGAKRQWRSEGARGSTRPWAHHLGAYQKVKGRTKKFFLYSFFDEFTQILKTTSWITVLQCMLFAKDSNHALPPTTNHAPKGRTKQ